MTRRTGRPILLAAVAAAVALAGCEARYAPTPVTVRPIDPKKASARELRDHAALSGVIAGADAGHRMIVAVTPPVPPVPPVHPLPPVPPAGPADARKVVVTKVEVSRGPSARPPAIKFTVRSEKPCKTEPEALANALETARIELMKKLQQLDPPVVVYPTRTQMRNEFLKKHQKVDPPDDVKAELEKSGVGGNRVYVEADIEVSQDQVQRLRAGERVNAAFKVAALLFALALAAHGFLRLDAWSKGYLTVWLAAGAVVLVAVAVLAVVA